MKKLNLLLLLIAILLLSSAYAETRVYNAILEVNGTVWRNQALVHYNANEFNNLKSGEGVNFYVDYRCNTYSIESYNSQYPSKQIQNITLRTIYTPAQTDADGDTTFLDSINETINLDDLDMPFPTRKKFFTLYDKESVTIILDTTYIGVGAFNRDSICEFDVNFGTQGCDRCREIAYRDFEQDVLEANTIEGYNTNIRDRIKSFLTFQYEFALIIYWIILIGLLLFAISVLIYSVFWIFHFVSHFLDNKK